MMKENLQFAPGSSQSHVTCARVDVWHVWHVHVLVLFEVVFQPPV